MCEVWCQEEIIDVCVCYGCEVVGFYFNFEILVNFDVSDHCVAFNEVWDSAT